MRGEQHKYIGKRVSKIGSPPLARGTEDGVIYRVNVYGITPACAGNSTFYRATRQFGWDHPRLRGEQEYAGREKPVAEGSPPLARGTGYL